MKKPSKNLEKSLERSKSIYEPLSDDPRFWMTDIYNAPSLAEKIKKSNQEDPVSQFIFSQQTSFAHEVLLESNSISDFELRLVLMELLNKVIENQELYTARRFRHLKLSAETSKLLKQRPKGEKLLLLNRWLLVDAYTDNLSKEHREPKDTNDFIKFLQGKVKHTEALLNSDPHFLACHPNEKCWMRQADFRTQQEDSIGFGIIKENCKRLLDQMEANAEKGFINGLRELVFLAHEATRRVQKWYEKSGQYEEYLSLVAEDYAEWPVLSFLAAKKDQEIRNRLRLNSALPNLSDAAPSRYNSTPPNRWTMKLLQTIESFRCWDGKMNKKGRYAKVSVTTGPFPWEYPDIYNSAKSLGTYSKKTWHEWFKVGQSLFLKLTNNKPWEIPELANYTRTERVELGGKKDRSADKKSEIMKNLRQSFQKFAPDC